MNRKKYPGRTVDATHAEQVRLLQSDPAQYFRENPTPQFGFSFDDVEGRDSRRRRRR